MALEILAQNHETEVIAFHVEFILRKSDKAVWQTVTLLSTLLHQLNSGKIVLESAALPREDGGDAGNPGDPPSTVPMVISAGINF